MKLNQICGCIQWTVPYRPSTQTTSFFRLINISLFKYLRANLSNKRKFITRKLTKYKITFSETTKKESLKYQKFEKRKNQIEKKLNWKKLKEKTKKCFYVGQILKNKSKVNDFNYLIAKTWFRIRYFSEDKRIIKQFFPTLRNSLPLSIVRTDTLGTTSFTF